MTINETDSNAWEKKGFLNENIFAVIDRQYYIMFNININ